MYVCEGGGVGRVGGLLSALLHVLTKGPSQCCRIGIAARVRICASANPRVGGPDEVDHVMERRMVIG